MHTVHVEFVEISNIVHAARDIDAYLDSLE